MTDKSDHRTIRRLGLAAVLLLVPLLAACSGGGSGQSAGLPTTAHTATSTPDLSMLNDIPGLGTGAPETTVSYPAIPLPKGCDLLDPALVAREVGVSQVTTSSNDEDKTVGCTYQNQLGGVGVVVLGTDFDDSYGPEQKVLDEVYNLTGDATGLVGVGDLAKISLSGGQGEMCAAQAVAHHYRLLQITVISSHALPWQQVLTTLGQAAMTKMLSPGNG